MVPITIILVALLWFHQLETLTSIFMTNFKKKWLANCFSQNVSPLCRKQFAWTSCQWAEKIFEVKEHAAKVAVKKSNKIRKVNMGEQKKEKHQAHWCKSHLDNATKELVGTSSSIDDHNCPYMHKPFFLIFVFFLRGGMYIAGWIDVIGVGCFRWGVDCPAGDYTTFCCWLWAYFTPCFSVFIFSFGRLCRVFFTTHWCHVLMLKALVMIFKTYLALRSKSIFLLVGFDQNVTNVDSVDIQNSTLTE